MSVLPSFKHAFSSLAAEVEPTVRVADDSSSYAHATTSSQHDRHRHPSSWIQPSPSNYQDPLNPSSSACPTTSSPELKQTPTATATTTTTISNTSRPSVSLLNLDLVTGGEAPAFGFDSRLTSSSKTTVKRKNQLEPLPIDVLPFAMNENPYLSPPISTRRAASHTNNIPTSFTTIPNKRRRVNDIIEETNNNINNNINKNNNSNSNNSIVEKSTSNLLPPSNNHNHFKSSPIVKKHNNNFTNSTITTTNPTPSGQRHSLSAPKVTIPFSQHLRFFHTTRSNDRPSSFADPLRSSVSPSNPRDRDRDRDRDRNDSRSPVLNGVHKRNNNHNNYEKRKQNDGMHSSGSFRLGQILDGPSQSPSCDGVETITRRGSTYRGGGGSGGPHHLLAIVEDSTGRAPVDVLSIPAQRSVQSALSGRTLQLAGMGVSRGGSEIAGVGGDIISMSQFPTASDFSNLGPGITTNTHGREDGSGALSTDNKSDLVDGTEKLYSNKKNVKEEGYEMKQKDNNPNNSANTNKDWNIDNNAVCDKAICETTTTTTTTTKTLKRDSNSIVNPESDWSLRNIIADKNENVLNTHKQIDFEDDGEDRNEVNGLENILSPNTNNLNGLQTSSEEDMVQCPHCPKRLRNQVTLQNHIKVVHHHNGNFQCTQCGLSFMWRSTLGNHVRLVHEKQRPYACDECGKAFRWKSHLREHYWVVHKGEKPFECKTCGKTFGRKNNMQKHMRKHEENQK